MSYDVFKRLAGSKVTDRTMSGPTSSRVACDLSSRESVEFRGVAGAKRINAFGRISLDDAPIGRLSDWRVNEITLTGADRVPGI